MKKLIWLAVVALFAFSLCMSGCQKAAVSSAASSAAASQKSSSESIGGIELKLDKSEYETETGTINLTVKNNSDTKIYYSPEAVLEINNGGTWKTVVPKNKITNDVMLTADAKGESDYSFAVKSQYETLDAGSYRIGIKVSSDEAKVNDADYIYALFTVK